MKNINAFLYPTPTELDRQVKQQAAERADAAKAAITRLFSAENVSFYTEVAAILGPPTPETLKLVTGLRRVIGDKATLRYLPGVAARNKVVSDKKIADVTFATEGFSNLADAISAAGLSGLWDDAPEDHGHPVGGCSVCDVDPSNEQPVEAGFVWVSHKGVRYQLDNMAAPHVFYALRMVWNHTVPPAFRVGEFKRYRDVPGWSAKYRREAINQLSAELDQRKHKSIRDGGLELEHKDQFADIKANAAYLSLGYW